MLRRLTPALVFACLLVLPLPLQAMTANEAFADGNRLYRDDLYWAALLRYEQALNAGMDTPALHYNTGVAHYKAGQHIRARESLTKALDSSQFRIAAQYNLGLNAYRMGDTKEALKWFRLVRDQQSNPTLAKYAEVAIGRINRERYEERQEFVERAERVKQTRKFTNFDVLTRIGFGVDNNPFRTPSEPYVDIADPNLPLVVPEVKSGAFMPVSLVARYQVNALENEGFFVGYRLGAKIFQDEELENANEYRHEASFGSEYRNVNEDGRKTEVYSAFTFGQADVTYYDPDDGTPRDVGGVNIADRLNYTRYGPELSFRRTWQRFSFGMEFKGQLWDYEDVEVVPSYDHEYFLVGLVSQYKFTRTSLFRVIATRYTRNYSERPAFDENGNQPLGNPPLRYDYLDLGVTARQRITKGMWFGVDYVRTTRTDDFVGYNDYTRDAFGAEFHWSPHFRFDLEASGQYRLFDYPNAFAFNEPAGGPKTREDARFALVGTFLLTRSLQLVAEARYREVVSNDIRISYERMQYALSVRWAP